MPAFMLGGVGGRDAASGGQTKEHAQLAKSLGVDQLAVVISKLDTCDYSQVGVGWRFWGAGVCRKVLILIQTYLHEQQWHWQWHRLPWGKQLCKS